MSKSVPASDRTVSSDSNAPSVGGISGDRLRAFIERIERLQSEVKAIQDDIKEVKAEAKGTGFDVKVMTWLIKLRKQDKDDLAEFEALVDTYSRAIGMEPPL